MRIRTRGATRLRVLIGLTGGCLIGTALLGTAGPAAHADGVTFPGVNGLIAYTHGGVLAAITPNGDARGYTLGTSVDCPIWSPDGKLLAYSNYGLVVMPPEDLVPVNAPVTVARSGRCPLGWSSDSEWLLFAMDDDQGLSRVRVDGSGLQTLVPEVTVNSAAFSPDGQSIAFGGQDSANQGLWVMSSDGSDKRLVAEYGDFRGWTPDGTKVITTYGRTIRLVAADGSGYRDLTEGSGPQVSPDGTQIAYIASNSLWVMGLDGSNQRQIAGSAGPDLAWSPDSHQIVFNEPYLKERDTPDVWTVNVDGAGLSRLLVRDGRYDTGPVELNWAVWNPWMRPPPPRGSATSGMSGAGKRYAKLDGRIRCATSSLKVRFTRRASGIKTVRFTDAQGYRIAKLQARQVKPGTSQTLSGLQPRGSVRFVVKLKSGSTVAGQREYQSCESLAPPRE